MTQHAKKAEVYSHWQIVFPELANTRGVMFGGKILAIMDMEAAVAASLFCNSAIATISIEQVDFFQPVYVGNRMETRARVVFTGKSSLVVHVECYAEDHLSGDRRICAAAFFNMVPLNKEGKSHPAPALLIDSDIERKAFEKAKTVHALAVQRRKSEKK